LEQFPAKRLAFPQGYDTDVHAAGFIGSSSDLAADSADDSFDGGSYESKGWLR